MIAGAVLLVKMRALITGVKASEGHSRLPDFGYAAIVWPEQSR
jgi:hypothetical protein